MLWREHEATLLYSASVLPASPSSVCSLPKHCLNTVNGGQLHLLWLCWGAILCAPTEGCLLILCSLLWRCIFCSTLGLSRCRCLLCRLRRNVKIATNSSIKEALQEMKKCRRRRTTEERWLPRPQADPLSSSFLASFSAASLHEVPCLQMHRATLKTSFVNTQQPLLQMKDTVPSSVIAAQALQ